MGNKLVEAVAAISTASEEVLPDILILKFKVVNAFAVGDPRSTDSRWVLVDTGLENSADFILECTERRFGKGHRPQAIILTHGHFDHVGSVITLANYWDVPVYIHPLEIQYITGKKDYPKGDAAVDEGLVAKISPTFPHKSIDIGYRAVALPMDGSVPGMDGWKWIATPGHTEGHISIFRENDRVLITGDALSTVKQESIFSVLTQKEQISGPPKYLTTDWKAAENSINRLKELKPSLVLPSHGQPMEGKELEQHLEILTNHFNEIAKPKHGKYTS